MSKSKQRVDLIGLDVGFDGPSIAVTGKVTGIVKPPGEMDLTVQLDISWNDQIMTEREAIEAALRDTVRYAVKGEGQ